MLTKEEIIEGNKLIAEFLHSYNNENEQPCIPDFICAAYFRNEMLYHSSWDWIMPAVNKIEFIENTIVVIQGCYCQINDVVSHKIIVFHQEFGYESLGERKLIAVWAAVIKFIKWYNQQPK